MKERRVSRRSILRGAGAGLAVAATAGVASACNLVGSPSSSGNGEKVTLRVAIVPDPSGASEFYREQFNNFSKKNSGITVQIIENPTDQQLNAVELMFQQDNPPDVFRCQGPQALDRFFSRGWTAALDEYAGNSLKSRFPEGALEAQTSGLHRDGKLHSLPLTSGQWSVGQFLVYNRAILADGGYSAPPQTIEEMDQMARALTAKGKGKYYGMAVQGQKASDIIRLQNGAGPSSIGDKGIDFRTGKAAVADKSLVDTVELYRKLQADKIFEPGWESWDGSRVFTEFAKEKVGFYVGAGWNVNEIKKLNPQLEYGVAPLPVPSAGRAGYIGQGSAFAPLWSMSAKSKNPEEAWKLMDFLVSEEFQAAYFKFFRTFTAVESSWREAKDLSDAEKGIITAFDETIRRAPDPATDGSAGAQKLMAALSAKPDLKYTDIALQSITRNEPFAPKAADLSSKLDTFLDGEIKKLSDAGTKVSRDDLTYADWDPLKDWKPSK